MNWNNLQSIEQLDAINTESEQMNVLIFKHSTRCGISAASLNRLERYWNNSDSEKIKPYYLDLLCYRNLSDLISQRYGVHHESPQVLIILKGKCVYSATHSAITYQDVINNVHPL